MIGRAKEWVKAVLPDEVLDELKGRRDAWRKKRREAQKPQPPLSKERLADIIRRDLRVGLGDTVFVHSAMGMINPAFHPSEILDLLFEIVGPEGTLLFPTYPNASSEAFLRSGQVFNQNEDASYTGLLTELARRHPGARRSLHPTKSVCAIGPLAERLVSTHHESPFPYSLASPYAKIVPEDGKVIGLGVFTKNMSFVHTVDDALGERFPVQPYLREMFQARCVEADGRERIVPTYSHDPKKMTHDVPAYMKAHIPSQLCEDRVIDNRPFFSAEAAPLFKRMVELAEQGVTIYPSSAYKWSHRFIGRGLRAGR